MNFGMIILHQSIKTMHNYVIWILTALFGLKLKIFADDIKKLFDTSNYSKDDKRPLSRSMNKKVIGLMKDELGEKIMINLLHLDQKHSYLMD